jgi:hypothetical protein
MTNIGWFRAWIKNLIAEVETECLREDSFSTEELQ